MKKIIILMLVMLSALVADPLPLTKTTNGFMFPSMEVKTYYKSKIVWGESLEHNLSAPAMGIAVVVWSNSDKWMYSTITNEEGKFEVEVKSGSAFRIKASDGSRWCEYDDIIAGISN